MKLNTVFRFGILALAAAIVLSLPASANDVMEVPWNQVCRVAEGKQLMLKTIDGNQVDGYCFRINADTISVTTLDKRTVIVARKTIAALRVRPGRGHQVAALRKGVRSGLRQGHQWLLSPHAILGLAVIPTTLAWGAVSLPFCVAGDIQGALTPDRDIRLVADRATP